jgi:hypothetical protein
LRLEAGINNSCLAPSLDIYITKVRSATQNFCAKVNLKLQHVKNASMKETDSDVQALFVLPQK